MSLSAATSSPSLGHSACERPPPRAPLVRAIAVTLGGVAVALAASRLPLPFLDDDAFRAAVGDPSQLGLFSLGFAPFLNASVIVEFVALTVPRLRRLRHGQPAGRAGLVRATWILAALMALLQGWGIGAYLRSLRDVRGGLPFADVPMAGLALSLAAACMLATLLATKMGEHGIGNGFTVLIAGGALVDLYATARVAGRIIGEVPLVWIAVHLVLAFVTLRLLIRLRTGSGPRVPFPTTGVVPLHQAVSLVALPATVAAWLPAVRWLAEAARPGTTEYGVALAAVALVLALVLARLFCSPDRVSAGWERAGLADSPTADDVRAALARANRRSAAFVLGLAVLASLMNIVVASALAVVVIVAVVLDLADEARARKSGSPSVPAWALHRVWAVEPVLAALSAAGIPAWTRARHFRALFHFFAPYAPIELHVPVERAADAAAICERIAADPEA